MGKRSDLSPQKIEDIKNLLINSGLNQKEIAKRLDVSRQSVGNIKKKLEKGLSLECRSTRKYNPKKKAAPGIEDKIKQQTLLDRSDLCERIASEMQEENKDVSQAIVNRNLQDDLQLVHPQKTKSELTKHIIKASRNPTDAYTDWNSDQPCESVASEMQEDNMYVSHTIVDENLQEEGLQLTRPQKTTSELSRQINEVHQNSIDAYTDWNSDESCKSIANEMQEENTDASHTVVDENLQEDDIQLTLPKMTKSTPQKHIIEAHQNSADAHTNWGSDQSYEPIASEMREDNVNVSQAVVSMNLGERNIHLTCSKKKSSNSKLIIQERLKFANAHAHWNSDQWEKVRII